MALFKRYINLGLRIYKKTRIYIVAFVVYISVTSILYNQYNRETEARKNNLLQSYYQMILNHSTIKLDDALSKMHINGHNQDIEIQIKQSDIIVCNSTQCKKENLFDFSSALDKYIPDYIYYKIDINNQLLHRNSKLDNYHLIYHNHIDRKNRLSISISLGSQYIEKLKDEIAKPFISLMILASLIMMLFVTTQILIVKYLNRLYQKKYKNHYLFKLNKATDGYKKALNVQEDSLMKKIWDLEYSNRKDKEFNHLFSKKANQLAMYTYDQANPDVQMNDIKEMPCSIILHHSDSKWECIDTKVLVKSFSDRFVNSEENISISIYSIEQSVRFVSKEFLYQIIYSIINCIIFILQQQPNTNKYKISIEISKKEGSLRLLCSYNGISINNEKDLIKFSSQFLANNANPFCVGINQIFHILKKDNFECIVEHDNLNYVKIVEKLETQNKEEEDNIIQFRT